MARLRFSFVLHNHQPVGNFEDVFEAAYRDSYWPFLEVLEDYPDIPFCLHTSGSLIEWLVDRKPEYVERLCRFVRRGQVEILGGGFYEPILPMIPPRDRIGQIRGYSEYLRELFACDVRGMWIAERVWEQSLVADLVDAKIEYTILDDFHFRKAGLRRETLVGHYLTEDQGKLLCVFPGSEAARYLIPFRDVGEVIGYFGSIHERTPEAHVVFADDGEKFGSWPETKRHVYEQGWLRRFLDALREHGHWIEPVTLAHAMDSTEPAGKIYLPDCSYREMTEWALPSDEAAVYPSLWHEADQHPRGRELRQFLQAGHWRNFKIKYPETADMYARMMEVSERLHNLCDSEWSALGDSGLYRARVALYRAQCNCAYWHGAFGGLYLPHLRNAVYENLIEADNRIEEFERGKAPVSLSVMDRDWNLDGAVEVRLANSHVAVYVAPKTGGQVYELDVRAARVNLGASLARRPEPYHERIRQNSHPGAPSAPASIHERFHVKQEGLDRHIVYDGLPRRLFVDRFLCDPGTVTSARAANWSEVGDFSSGPYDIERMTNGPHASVELRRRGTVDGQAVALHKSIRLYREEGRIQVRYAMHDLPMGRPLWFAVESTFGALASRAEDRYLLDERRQRIGQIGDVVTRDSATGVALVDEWLGVEVGLISAEPATIWTFPVETVSQSEGGFELVYQGCGVVFAWPLPKSTSWDLEIQLTTDCQHARIRRRERLETVDC